MVTEYSYKAKALEKVLAFVLSDHAIFTLADASLEDRRKYCNDVIAIIHTQSKQYINYVRQEHPLKPGEVNIVTDVPIDFNGAL